ncbi:MAG: GTP cyclohydrolase II, partial [Proteobacteria bacterium]|nr:GTP cyclohydrolase II [Pseudomonadota bacterium]
MKDLLIAEGRQANAGPPSEEDARLLPASPPLGCGFLPGRRQCTFACPCAMKLEHIVSTRLPTPYGEFVIHGFREDDSGQEHVVLSMGELTGDEPPLVRVHSECMTGEVFGSLRCDCRPQLESAMKRIAAQGRGAIVYMRGHEGRGIGLVQKLRAYAEQDAGKDTIEANAALGLPIDARRYDAAACMLRALGVHRIRLLTNNPLKMAALAEFGIE